MIIDAHMHYADDDPDFLALLAEFDLKFLNICFVRDPAEDWRPQAHLYRDMAAAFPHRFAWCTSFSLPAFSDPAFDAATWVDQAIAALDADFAQGALACKVWKNVGMELRRADGSFVMPDDPIFDPVYEHLAARSIPLLTHIAEPLECWLPLNPASPHHDYYANNSEWHMYTRPDYPSHSRLIAARDAILAKHPALRMVGAHLGSLEYDTDEVAARLDRYPNFAVDISARLIDLMAQPSPKVRDFFLRHADRILFGTDVVMRVRPSAMSPTDRAEALGKLRAGYTTHFAYFTGHTDVTFRNRIAPGLDLPADVLDQFFITNAQRWYPSLFPA
jgi:predicted TIM-barrel fold metal-dependent hydrolase